MQCAKVRKHKLSGLTAVALVPFFTYKEQLFGLMGCINILKYIYYIYLEVGK